MPNRVPPPREFNWARTLRTLSFWALLIVGSIALVQFASSRRQEAVEISYTQFTEQLDGGNVAAVEITERQQIKGDFKHAVAVGRRSAEYFTPLLPCEARSEWVQAIQQKGVDVGAREEKRSFGVFLFSFLPYLFILGLIIFMLRMNRAETGRSPSGNPRRSCSRATRRRSPSPTWRGATRRSRSSRRSSTSSKIRRSSNGWGAGFPRAPCSSGRPGPARPCSRRPWRARRGGRSSRCRDRTSLRCSWGSGPRGCATCSSRARPTRPASSSSTRSTPSGATVERGSAGETTRGGRR